MNREEDCRDPQRVNAYALKESTAQVEAVGLDGEQREGQAYAAKNEYGAERVDVNLGSCHAGNCLSNRCHYVVSRQT